MSGEGLRAEGVSSSLSPASNHDKEGTPQGTWVSQGLKNPTLGFTSGCDLRVVGWSLPAMGASRLAQSLLKTL